MNITACVRMALLSGAVMVAAFASAVAQAPPTAAPADLLTRPMTPGAVAMLALDSRSPQVQRRLAEALRHERADVRTVAARVATVTASRDQVATLIEVLGREADVAAAREQIRALLILGGSNRNAAGGAWRSSVKRGWSRHGSRASNRRNTPMPP
jgi:hypothetical protein